MAIVSSARGRDEYGYRAELLQLVRAAQAAPGLPS
jgi:hypothetical protein